MIYSDKHKCIFIHLPKTGGESILSVIGADKKHFTVEEVFKPEMLLDVPDRFGSYDGPSWFNRTYSTAIRDRWDEYYKFAFVRNPYSRCVSEYFYNVHRVKNDKYEKTINDMGGVDTRIPTVEPWFKKYVILNKDNTDVWKAPYYNWLCKDNTIDINFIGKLETLQADFDMICDKIGIPKQILPHKNKSKHKHYTEYYDDETRQIVADKYKKDIEYFGYEFGE